MTNFSKLLLTQGCFIAIILTLTACTGEEKVVWCSNSIDNQSPILSSGFGANTANTRNNISEITSQTVANLKLRYTLSQPEQEERRGAVAVTEQALFFHEEHAVRAINRETGCQYWATAIAPKLRSAATLVYDDPTLGKRMVAVGTVGAEIIAMDARTGKRMWQKDIGEFDENAVTGGLQYYDGKLLVPLSSLEVSLAVVQTTCCKTHGSVVALDSANGETLWRFHTTEKARRLSSRKWGPSGVSVWSSPLIDTERNQVLVGTSQNFTSPATQYSDSVVALDLNTGQVKWWHQVTPLDIYNMSCDVAFTLFPNCTDLESALDWDVTTPVLTEDSQGRDLIIGADKGGNVFGIDPDDGTLRWRTHIGAGTTLGGIHWGMAVDDHAVYFGINDLKASKLFSVALLLGVADLIPLEVNYVVAKGGMPGVFALDKDTGNLLWSHTEQRRLRGKDYPLAFSAAVSVTNDVVFAGSLSGELIALHSKSGELLWRYNSAVKIKDVYGRKGQGGTIDSVGPVVVGQQVFLNSGYGTFGESNEFHGGPGNTLFVFSLEK